MNECMYVCGGDRLSGWLVGDGLPGWLVGCLAVRSRPASSTAASRKSMPVMMDTNGHAFLRQYGT